MATLYSQNARKVLLKSSKTWNKKDKFFKILKIILKRNYKNKLIHQFFQINKPELILYKMIHKFNPELKDIFKKKLVKNISSFGFNTGYFSHFLKYLNVNCLNILYTSKNDIYLNIDSIHKYSRINNDLKYNIDYKSVINTNPDIYKNEINDILKNIPDIIILTHHKLYNVNSKIFENNINFLKIYKYADIFNAKSYENEFKINPNDLKNYKEKIVLNGHTYVLDSCILSNFGENKSIHAIAGITCNNQRYVYNGWTRTTNDPAMRGQVQETTIESPCSLMEFNWNLKSSLPFCLNTNYCKLDFDINKKNLCFSFAKGDRLLIYVRSDLKTETVSTTSSINNSSQEIKNFIISLFDIPNMNIEDIKLGLQQKFNLTLNDMKDKSIHQLRQLLYDKLYEYYRTKHLDKEKEIEIKNIDNQKLFKSRSLIHKKYKDIHIKNPIHKLLQQQVFLSNFIQDNFHNIDKMLLFHGIGTGKTCTSITIAEKIMEINPSYKILVILPARLKTNFIDELISENCGLNRYISKKDFDIYNSPSTSQSVKANIRKKFITNISNNYDIKSYENIRLELIKSNDIKKSIEKLTHNKVVIIDEVHNLISTNIKPSVLSTIISSNKIHKNVSNINGVILRLITKLAHSSSKMFFLTATPIFDNYGQFLQLVLNLCPTLNNNSVKKNMFNIKFLIQHLRGKISFYKLNDLSNFPKVNFTNLEIHLSKFQYQMISQLWDSNQDDNNDEKSNKFCITERQLSISAYNKLHKDKIFSDLMKYAPKLHQLFKLLELKGKHVIYSNFIEYCLKLIALYLEENGWNNYIKSGIKPFKTFVLWDASLNDIQKQDIKIILNSPDNIDGSKIRVILGSPSIKEGISFKHVQYLHQIDPVWNSSAKEQIEGRVIRYKSHDDIPTNHPFLKRNVTIYNYIAIPPKEDKVNITCDQKIYNDIIVKKRKVIKIIESLLSKVAIDYYLWNDTFSPKIKSKTSSISMTSEEGELKDIIGQKKFRQREVKNKNTCPKPRRPIDGKCNKDYPFLTINKNGNQCCYKKQPKNKK